jgi:Domain of unknown function (DUF4157)
MVKPRPGISAKCHAPSDLKRWTALLRVGTAAHRQEKIMSIKERAYSNDNQASSKQPLQKPAAKALDILTHQQPNQANPIQRAGLPGSLAAHGNRAVGRLLAGTANSPGSERRSVQHGEESHQGNRTALPNKLKAGIESLSGLAMDDVKVHYNSPKPAEVKALAHTQGSNIYVGQGQEKHLPHEAWHVVQQKQGRVKPTDVLTKGASINDDPGLEREADEMGARASQAGFSEHVQKNNLSPVSQTVQREVMQFKKVPTNFGEFETTKFGAVDDSGVEIILKFHPDDTKVDAKKIGLSQSIRKTGASGTPYAIDPTQAGKMVAAGKSGAGYAIDRLSDMNNPIYGAKKLGASETLKDTPESENTTAAATEVGTNTKYELGHCFKEKPTDATKKKHSAGLWDKAQSAKVKGRSKTFETTALAIDGADTGKYYGSVSWGYKVEGTEAAPILTPLDITEASKGTPTANFMEAAKLWNLGKARGTLVVIADPEATVQKADGSEGKVAKGKKLKQLRTVVLGTDQAIEAEVLKDDGTGSGNIITIKNSDVKDMGDGLETKDLPVPADKPAVKPAVKK